MLGLRLCIALCAIGACSNAPTQRLVLGATHTLEDSGLLEELRAAYAEESGDHVSVVVAGSGEILAMAARGDVDVVLSHSPEAELRLVAAGSLIGRRRVMSNDFIIAGPADDPAAAGAAASAAEALRRVALAGSMFVSRGDDSGTHVAERALWQDAGMTPSWGGYVEAGAGMADALRLASQRQAYVLTDRATLAALQSTLELEALYENPAELPNTYSVLTSATARNHAGAGRLAAWLTGARAREIIAGFEAGGRKVFDVADHHDE